MSAPRRVRTLHITGPDSRRIQRAVPLVEDALNTASLPPTPPGRLLVIRRLDLGEIALDKPAQTLALRIEEALRALSFVAIDAERPGAAQAQAVFFREPAEARAALITRLVRGPPPTEWFWRSAIQSWLPAQAAPLSISALLAPPPSTRPSEPAPLVFMARVAEGLLQRGVLEEVLAQVPPELLPWPGPAAPTGAAPPASAPSTDPAPEPPPRLAPRWRALLRALAQRWGREHPIVARAAAVAIVASRPERAAAPAHLAAQVRTLLSPPPQPLPPPPPAAEPSRPPARVAPAPGSPDAAPPARAAGPTAAEPAPESPRLTEPAAPRVAWIPPARVPSAPPSPPYSPTQPRWLDDPDWPDPQLGWAGLPELLGEPKPTDAAGLFFATPLLERLRMPALLQAEPHLIEQALPWRVLSAILDHLGFGAEDPMREVLAQDADPESDEPFDAPTSHRALVQPGEALLCTPPPRPLLLTADGLVLRRGKLGIEPPNAPLPDETTYRHARVVGWRAALDRRLQRDAELPLPALVRRWGWVAATPTHIDVVLPLGGLDMSVRRAALDITPGWVPWLGRVVTVHYVEDELMGLPPRVPWPQST